MSYLGNKNSVSLYNSYTKEQANSLFGGVPRYNHIINGGFEVNQRGESSYALANGYTLDRWCMVNSAPMLVSQQEFELGQTDVPNAKYFLRAEVEGGFLSSDRALIVQRMEDVRTLAGKTVTFSFYAKSDIPAEVSVEFAQIFGAEGTPSPSNDSIGIHKIALSNEWTRYAFTIEVPSLAGKTLGTKENTSHFDAIIWFSAGSDFDGRTNSLGAQSAIFDLAMVQLEEGPNVGALSYRSYAEELRLCQRYFTGRIYFSKTYHNGTFGEPQRANGFGEGERLFYPVPMRANPTLKLVETQSGFSGSHTVRINDSAEQNPTTCYLRIPSESSVANPYVYGYIEADAELY